MSLEEEMVEISVIYHGQREHIQELEKLVREYHQLFQEFAQAFSMLPYDDGIQLFLQRRDALAEKAKVLLGGS